MAHSVWIVLIVSVTTILLRFLPFWIFGNGRKTPRVVSDLGKTLPFAAMGMLVVYCMKGISFSAPALWAPQLISAAVTAGLYLLRRNTLLSIVGGTVCCMILTQLVF